MNDIHAADALSFTQSLPSQSVDCVITSPPYYRLRDYGVDGQWGLEETPTDYIDNLTGLFDEIKRVLKPTGTVWVNLGDTQIDKRLLMIPARFAIAMSANWILRSEIIWHKPTVKPESVKDRPTQSHEMIYLFTQQERYYWDNVGYREKASPNSHGGGKVNYDRKVALGIEGRQSGLKLKG